MTGKLANRENSAATAAGSPSALAQPMVEPDLEIPGKAATPWTTPIRKACLMVGASGRSVCSCGEGLSL